MARPKKTDAPPAGAPNGVAPLTITMDEAIFMRDKFMTGLISLESGITALRVAYAEHLNTFLPANHPARLVLPSFQVSYDGSGDPNAPIAPGIMPRFGRSDTPNVAVIAVDGSKKKKRKPHDPNAPKRALTSYFLFMAENKPAIKADNEGWTSQQVSEESERRWQNISPQEKAEYEMRYQIDLCRYYKQKEAYEAGEPIPVVDANAARALYEEQQKSGLPPKGRKAGKKPASTTAPAAVEDAASEATSSEEEEEEEEPAPPPVAERSSKRQKTSKDETPKAAAKPTPKGKAEKAKPSAESPVADTSAKSPEKEKKKRMSKKKASQLAEEAEVASSSPATQAKEKKTRKRKSEA